MDDDPSPETCGDVFFELMVEDPPEETFDGILT